MPFYSYLTESERMDAYNEACEDIFLNKIDNMFERCAQDYMQALAIIEAKQYIAEYTDSDMEYMQGNAVEVYTEAVKDVWGKFTSALGKIIKKITTNISFKFAGKGAVRVKFVPAKVRQIIEKIVNIIRGSLSMFNPDGTIKKGRIAAAFGAGAIGIGVIMSDKYNDAMNGETVMKAADFNKFKEFIKKSADVIKSTFEKIKAKAIQAAGKIADKGSDGELSVLRKVIMSVTNFINKVTNKILDAAKLFHARIDRKIMSNPKRGHTVSDSMDDPGDDIAVDDIISESSNFDMFDVDVDTFF